MWTGFAVDFDAARFFDAAALRAVRASFTAAVCAGAAFLPRLAEVEEAALRAIRLSPRDPSLAIYYAIAAYARFVERDYHEAIALARIAVRQRGDLVAAYRILVVAAGMAGESELASSALQEVRRAQPNISLDWIAKELPWTSEADREHYLEGFRRAGLR